MAGKNTKAVDPQVEQAQRLASIARASLDACVEPSALARQLGVSAAELRELVAAQFHTTPSLFLHDLRVEAAGRALVQGKRGVSDIALKFGFERSTAFGSAIRAKFAMAPSALAELGTSNEFVLELPRGFRREECFAQFARDPDGILERVDGALAQKSVLLKGRPAVLCFERKGSQLRVRVEGLARPGKERVLEAHAIAVRLLGLVTTPGPFESWAKRTPDMARLVSSAPGLRVAQTANAFEGLVWVIVGQQVNLTFAATCRARLAALAGQRVGDFVAHPDAQVVAEVEVDDLLELQFSRRKAEYVIDTARLIVSGELDLDGLHTEPVGEIERRLLSIRGLGPWSVYYLAMRAFGLSDCVPAGDVALALALKNFFALSERPDAAGTVLAMRAFAPHRSLATMHLWRAFC